MFRNTHPLPQVVLTAPPRQLKRAAHGFHSRDLACACRGVIFLTEMTRIEDRNSWGGQVVWFVALSLISTVLYSWSLHVLKKSFDFYFVICLLVPCGYYYWKYPTKKQRLPRHELLSRRVALVLLAYSFVYFVLINFVHILAASIALWLVQFTIPVVILKVSKVRLSAIGFEWRMIFGNFTDVIIVSIWLTPFLFFGVRDAEAIRRMTGTPSFYLYLPLGVLYMLLIVAFWEEFFFRGVLLRSLEACTGKVAIPVFLSGLLFGVYHFPMRYFNQRSPFFHDAMGSLASTIQEQFLMGLFLAFVVYRSRNVWQGIWLHAFLNGFSSIYQVSKMIKFS
ncbi:MAG: CPBP family intramembrane glutamic endopeptidase [Pyrinomonadaceae bacterium]